mmetsp:Transcript_78705/g.240849  ORF Transcript_78705/g.240849 Transcript_78705/m.240849 type:complete len:344 (-) Transcript_78705:660-1691(-)
MEHGVGHVTEVIRHDVDLFAPGQIAKAAAHVDPGVEHNLREENPGQVNDQAQQEYRRQQRSDGVEQRDDDRAELRHVTKQPDHPDDLHQAEDAQHAHEPERGSTLVEVAHLERRHRLFHDLHEDAHEIEHVPPPAVHPEEALWATRRHPQGQLQAEEHGECQFYNPILHWQLLQSAGLVVRGHADGKGIAQDRHDRNVLEAEAVHQAGWRGNDRALPSAVCKTLRGVRGLRRLRLHACNCRRHDAWPSRIAAGKAHSSRQSSIRSVGVVGMVGLHRLHHLGVIAERASRGGGGVAVGAAGIGLHLDLRRDDPAGDGRRGRLLGRHAGRSGLRERVAPKALLAH